MKRFYPKRRAAFKKRKQVQRGLKAACLSLTLATAWGGEASADATLKVEITPAQALSNALVYYGNNVSTGVLASLGSLPGGETSTVFHTFHQTGSGICYWVCDADSYGPGGNQPAVYAIIGLYEGASGTGVSVSFPNDDPIVQMETWSSLFESAIFPSYHFAEPEIITALLEAEPDLTFPPTWDAERIPTFMRLYAEGDRFVETELGTDYGNAAVLVNLSEATFGGTVIVSLVPEPTSWCLLISAAGVAWPGRRLRA